MKIKIFGREDSDRVFELEEEVNTWLKAHPDIEIAAIKQTASGGSFADTKFYITIWYNEGA